jgi:hypothetical protein
MYGYILINQRWAIKQGEFLKIKEIPDEIKYGIYYCEIKTNNSFYIKKNKKNCYTHIDIIKARKLKYEIIMDDTKEFNFIYYSDDKLVDGKFLFEEYIDYLQSNKVHAIRTNNKICKDICKYLMSTIWGHLCERNKKSSSLYNEIHKGWELKNIQTVNKNNIITIQNKESYYSDKAFLPRIKPFILAFGRNMITNYILKYHLEDILIRCHTDSLYLMECPNQFKYMLDENYDNTIIGKFKYEGLCSYYVKNIQYIYEIERINDNEFNIKKDIEIEDD